MSLPTAKKTRAQGSMPALTESELIMVTKMIYRAAKHGQLEMVMGLLRRSPGEKHLIDEVSAKVGAMSDATKRRRDGDEEPTGSSRGDPDLAFENWCHDMVASGNLDWECVSQLSGFSEESCVTTPKSYMPANVPKAKAKSRFDVVRTGPVPDKYKPENIPNAKAWSTVLCKLPKVEDLKLSYGELVELAETDEDIRDYLEWTVTHLGAKDGKLPKTMKGGADFALFLQYIDWKPVKASKPSGKSTFKHEFKK